MAVLPIVELGNPLLRQPSAAVADPTSAEVRRIFEHMHDTLDDYRSRTGYGRALAAPQLGFLQRLVLVKTSDVTLELVNPRFERWGREEDLRYESCFSFPGLWGLVQRPVAVVVAAWLPDGSERRIEADGSLARILQHEIDHLDSLIWLDRNPDLHSLCTTGEYEKRYTSR